MPRPRVQIYADLPATLQRADEVLHLYGQWATTWDGRAGGNCGSAERMYRPERGLALEARRDPKPVLMTTENAMRCQRALASVPDVDRKVLSILYIPRGMPAEQQLRLLRIPPQLSQVRHVSGVKIWWNWYRLTGGQ